MCLCYVQHARGDALLNHAFAIMYTNTKDSTTPQTIDLDATCKGEGGHLEEGFSSQGERGTKADYDQTPNFTLLFGLVYGLNFEK